jgi:hypothetical protein
MGRRDEPELTPGDEELAAAEAATRRLLEPFGEPALLEPPAGLAARVTARLPGAPRRARPWRGAVAWAASLAAALLLSIGAWGVLVNSLGPSRAAGGPEDGLGQLVLTLTLAAKPMVNLLADPGLAAAAALLTAATAAWFWWRIVRNTPLVPPAEARV